MTKTMENSLLEADNYLIHAELKIGNLNKDLHTTMMRTDDPEVVEVIQRTTSQLNKILDQIYFARLDLPLE